MINWNDMRYFLALSRKNSFVAAARELKVTHTTVARRISALEESLNTTLFQRTEKGCTLTPDGERLIVHAEELESTVLNLEESVSGDSEQLTGTIRLGAPDGIGNSYLPGCLAGLQADHASLEVELLAVPMYYSLSKREIDLLITVRRPQSGNVVIKKLTDYRLGLFATRKYLGNHPTIRRVEDLREHRIIGYIDDLLFDRDLQFMAEILPGLSPRFRSTTVIAQMNGVAAGAGIGVIPYFMAGSDPSLLPLLPERSITRGYWLQVHSDSRQLARVRTTIDFLVARVEADQDLFLELPKR